MEQSSTGSTPAIQDKRLKLIRRISRLLDEQFSVGGFKFGIDPLLNLIPVAGDVGGYLMSIGLIITMAQYGASGKVVAKMVLNATLDALVGAIPVLGWIFDFAYKANTRNVKLLTAHYTEGRHKGGAGPVIFTVLIVTGVILILVLFIAFKFLQWMMQWGDKAIGIKI
ncbi:hypothetical protein A8C56_05805 [Niabella ginsenosidivorans]|uniref:DUF4112 domain-containing protein n=1 Tax=Niabella ginsenosidivorans TaxID=1176587 RepID=A0A1A9HYV6_9BACT|nr:DUF4112 domain-containing protein [Niabella ginsenosidivorans]ANH80566.1 hypothetical protein A8C56_05805 [Niabella ginsenosidivorans]